MGSAVKKRASAAETLKIYEHNAEKALTKAHKSFVSAETSLREAGEWLAKIHHEKLYEPLTWAAYLEQRWKKSRWWGYRAIQFAEICADLLPTGNMPTPSERVARELAKLPPAERRQVWMEAQAIGNPTAETIGELTRDRLETMAPREQAAAIQERENTTRERVARTLGGEARAQNLKAIDRLCQGLRRRITRLGDEGEEPLRHLQRLQETLPAT